MNKRALVTGSSGFLGTQFCQALRKQGYLVRPADIITGPGGDVRKIFTYSNETYDLIVHAAAKAPHRKAIDTEPGNPVHDAALDAAMFNWAIETQQPRVLYISSSAVYSPTTANGSPRASRPYIEDEGHVSTPFDSYGEVKRWGENLAHAAIACGVNVSIIRPFSGYGETQSENFPFGAFVRRAVRRENPFTIWGSADQLRDFIHVSDIVHAALTLVDREVVRPVNIATGVGTSMHQLAIMVADAVARHSGTRYSPVFEVDTTAPMGVTHRVGDPSLLHDYYVPRIDLKEGVMRAVRSALA